MKTNWRWSRQYPSASGKTGGDRSRDRLCCFGKCFVHDWRFHPGGRRNDRRLNLIEGRLDCAKCGMIKTQYVPKGGKNPMPNVVKKHSISFELAQKMVNAAVAKARELGVSE